MWSACVREGRQAVGQHTGRPNDIGQAINRIRVVGPLIRKEAALFVTTYLLCPLHEYSRRGVVQSDP